MEQLVKSAFIFLGVVFVAAAVLAFPLYAIGALAAVVSGGLIARTVFKNTTEGIKSLRKDASASLRRRRERRQGREQSASKVFDRKRGWTVEEFPDGMVPDLSAATDKSMPVSVFGLDGFVRAERKGDRVDFSFNVDDESKAAVLLKACSERHFDARVSRGKEKGVRFVVDLDPRRAGDEDAVREVKEVFVTAGLPCRVVPVDGGGARVESLFVSGDGAKEKMALNNASYIPGIRTEQAERPVWRVVSHEPKVAKQLADIGYSMTDVHVEKELTESREYLVHGCSSYEEAVGRVREAKGTLVPDNTVVKSVVRADGVVVSDRTEGVSMSETVGAFPAGTYLVSESSVASGVGTLRVPGALGTGRDLHDFVKLGSASSVAELRKGDAVFTDITPKTAMRFLEAPDGRRLRVVACDDDSLAVSGLKAFVSFGSMKELQLFINEGQLPEGTFMTLSEKAPAGRFVVSFDLKDSRDIADSICLSVPISDFAAGAKALGVPYRDLVWSELLSDVGRDGYAVALAGKDIPFGRLMVNGVPMDDCADRLSNSRLDPLDDESLGRWLEDASHIESASVVIDPMKMEMRLTATVDGETQTERFPLTPEHVSALQGRNNVNDAEIKNLVIETHPDYFGSYSTPQASSGAPVKSVSVNAVDNFIKGLPVEKRSAKPKQAKGLKSQLAPSKMNKISAKPSLKPGGPSVKR